jgi:ATP-dependent DNA helicase PIF1
VSLLESLLSSLHDELGVDQKRALAVLAGEGNVFLTGGAGTGKSYVVQKFVDRVDPEKFPVLASTGAAAILIGGRTFHSYFGLGLMEGGVEATVERVLKNKRVLKRLTKAKGIIIDEISMISGQALEAAEKIACGAREDHRPWGGLKVIGVGDFAQLPPVPQQGRRDWAFQSETWNRSHFQCVEMRETQRARDVDFANILNTLREGTVDEAVRNLLDWRSHIDEDPDFSGSILFARRDDVDRLNRMRLAALPGEATAYPTTFTGDEKYQTMVRRNLPIPEILELKPGALVMFRQNDPMGRWANGTLGRIVECDDGELLVKLLKGRTVSVMPSSFRMLDGAGNELATVKNFPINLAYAVTIHKAQGATLDRVQVRLQNLWEPGQAYVALSRVRSSDDLFIDGWDVRSIIADPMVRNFHERIRSRVSENL